MKVYIDAGHGGKDPGACAYGHKEKKMTLTTAKACRDYLRARGVLTKMSREKDETTNINDMAQECNRWGADLCLSIHVNAGKGDGCEFLHQVNKKKSIAFAKALEKRTKEIGQNSRGLKAKMDSSGRDYFGMLRLPRCPAVIAEGFFIDNKKDLKDFDEIKEQKELGYAYAKAALDYFGIKIIKSYKAVTAVNANIRKGRSTKYGIKKTIAKGTEITIYRKEGKWGFCKVEDKEGITRGWIALSTLKEE